MVRWLPAGSPQFRGGASIPAPGVAVHEAKIPDDLVATLRRLADELEVTAEFGAVGCARQGTRRTVRRTRGRHGLRRPARRPAVALQADDRTPTRGATLLLATHRAESQLLAHT